MNKSLILKIEKNNLPREALKVWRFRLTTLLVLLAFVSGIMAVFSLLIAALFGSLSLFVYLYLIFVGLEKMYSSEKYVVSSDYIYLEKGGLLTKKVLLNSKKIQYIEFTRGPIQKKYGVCTLNIFTAGSRVSLSQVKLKEALGIRNLLEQEAENEVQIS